MAIPAEPLTREETYLAKAAGQSVNLPDPVTRREMYLKAIAENAGGGGGASITVDSELSGTSTNPLQNRAIFSALDSKVEMNATATLVYLNRNGTRITMADSSLNFMAIYNLFTSAFKTYFVLPLSLYDVIVLEVIEVDVANSKIVLVGYTPDLTYMYRIVLTQDSSDRTAPMTGTLTEYSLVTTNEQISGTTPSIVLADNTVFSAGTLTSLTVTGSLTESQSCVIVFTSGSTATQLTLPSTLLMPDSFAVEANKVYEISIMGNRGAVQSWSAT